MGERFFIMEKRRSMKTILTGIRVNSGMTLGNFLGALLPMVRLANEYSNEHHVNIFVPDLHTVIGEVDGNLQKNLLLSLKYYLAAGLQIREKVHIYRQSRVPAHSELCWLLNCVATMGELSRMTQYKEKGEGKTSVNVGIFDYPVLMAGDILLYSANFVPVGEDQLQHLELTRDLAMRFNKRYGEVFVVPEKAEEQIKFMKQEVAVRIRDLVDPTKKMSKSAKSENSKIMLMDEPEVAAKKIRSATTDSMGKIQFDMFNQPGISNLLQIEALVTDRPLLEVVGLWSGQTQYGELKQKVAGSVKTMLSELQARVAGTKDSEVLELLAVGEEYANGVAGAKLEEVQMVMGLR